jgi:hypothetical protein
MFLAIFQLSPHPFLCQTAVRTKNIREKSHVGNLSENGRKSSNIHSSDGTPPNRKQELRPQFCCHRELALTNLSGRPLLTCVKLGPEPIFSGSRKNRIVNHAAFDSVLIARSRASSIPHNDPTIQLK